MNHCIVVGRGMNYANVYELAIKLMETCYIIAERFSSADFLHGPIAMVERDFPVFLFAPPGRVLAGLRSLAQRLKSLEADTFIISSEKSILKYARCPIQIPISIPDLYSAIPYIIYARNPDPARSSRALRWFALGVESPQTPTVLAFSTSVRKTERTRFPFLQRQPSRTLARLA
jgi:hypothetical protein